MPLVPSNTYTHDFKKINLSLALFQKGKIYLVFRGFSHLLFEIILHQMGQKLSYCYSENAGLNSGRSVFNHWGSEMTDTESSVRLAFRPKKKRVCNYFHLILRLLFQSLKKNHLRTLETPKKICKILWKYLDQSVAVHQWDTGNFNIHIYMRRKLNVSFTHVMKLSKLPTENTIYLQIHKFGRDLGVHWNKCWRKFQ